MQAPTAKDFFKSSLVEAQDKSWTPALQDFEIFYDVGVSTRYMVIGTISSLPSIEVACWAFPNISNRISPEDFGSTCTTSNIWKRL
jgi:hypothetical protein